jgi:hypothetical protein
MQRETLIAKLSEIQRNAQQPPANSRQASVTLFAVHLYRSVHDHSGKGGTQIERSLLSTLRSPRAAASGEHQPMAGTFVDR